MRVLFVTHYFHPEVGAPQTRILEAARLLRHRGHSVTVLTGFPNYPDGVIPEPYRGRLFMRERLEGMPVVRSAVYPAPNRGFARRLLNHASFALSSVLAAPASGPVDVVIAETPPLFTAVAAVPIAAAHRAPLVLNVADLWPESAVQLGLLTNRAAIRGAELLERFAYAYADAISVPTPGMRSILLRRGVPEAKVVLLRNAVDVDRFAAVPPSDHVPRRVLYCGTVGLAQGVGTLIEAASRLEEQSDLEVVIAGDGAERPELELRSSELGLRRVRFAGRVSRDQVPRLIASADITVMSLRDLPLFQDAVPTKLLEYMAAGKPVVAAAAGQVAELLEQAQAGVACPPEDPVAMAEAIRAVASDSDRAREMGRNGRRYVEEHLSRRAFVEQLEGLLESVVPADDEAERVRRVYRAYERSARRAVAWSPENPGNRQIIAALQGRVESALRSARAFPDGDRRLLDVGCGRGELLGSLLQRGAVPGNLAGVDLLENRVAAARAALPSAVDVREADARALPVAADSVDAVVMSTLLGSIVDGEQRVAVANEALRVLRPGGVVLCYDARLPNPANPRVRAVTRAELRRLFRGCRIEAETLTLLPPLARRLGGATRRLYPLLARIPVLRTHLFAVIRPSP